MHVEISADGYEVIVVSSDGFSVGDHVAQIYLNGGPALQGSARAIAAEDGWMLSVNGAGLSATLSGD